MCVFMCVCVCACVCMCVCVLVFVPQCQEFKSVLSMFNDICVFSKPQFFSKQFEKAAYVSVDVIVKLIIFTLIMMIEMLCLLGRFIGIGCFSNRFFYAFWTGGVELVTLLNKIIRFMYSCI